jgi:hypothetical protein
MTRLRPACDRHPNLQMIPCSLKTTAGQAQGYVCPVPNCGRHYDDTRYFDAVETRALLEGSVPSRREAVRTAIVKTLGERLRPLILPYKQK